MTAIETSRAALAALLGGVSGIGQVHDYFRLTAHDADTLRLFTSGGRLHCWFVSLSDDEPYEEELRPARCRRARIKFDLHGYYAVDDAAASEKAFTSVLQSVLTALRAGKTLSGTVILASPARVREAGYRTFVDTVCHYLRLEVLVVVEVNE